MADEETGDRWPNDNRKQVYVDMAGLMEMNHWGTTENKIQ